MAPADLTDLGAMTRALGGVRGACVVNPQQYGRDDLFELADRIALTTAHAALEARVPRLVALSSVGGDRAGGTGRIGMNRMVEQRLGEAGIPALFLRAAYFMENWAPLIAHAVRTGTLPTFLARRSVPSPMVATADVGATAAALLREEWTGTGAVTLAGPRDYAPNDVAAIVSATLGAPVDVAVLPEAQWPQALADAGFSNAALAGFVEMTRGLNGSHIDMASDPGAGARLGPTPLERVVADLARRLR
ncbi:NmrA family NAD(P)-binding protein [Massilia sp. TW-1]|uniref:NmrA family NAD(P)-binding protein n=1 Tax=Telluria antibiotica TaxID=2717319 RepID=A0ABX0PA57_9BURK|nr:NmrA family NAD(P)-binding protein [Telluria antibiotica]